MWPKPVSGCCYNVATGDVISLAVQSGIYLVLSYMYVPRIPFKEYVLKKFELCKYGQYFCRIDLKEMFVQW